MINKIICTLFTIVICIGLCLAVTAQKNMQTSPDIIIEKYPISQEEKEKCMEDLNLQVVAYEPEQYRKAWMTAVDVSQSEILAVAYNNESIIITDKDFKVHCVLKFNSHKLSYYINWNGNNLELFFNRSDKIYTISANGELLDVNTFEIGSEAASDASEKLIDTVNGNTYKIRPSRFLMTLAGTNYDNLVRIDSNGNEVTLFQSENTVPLTDIGFFVFYFGGLSFFAVLIPVSVIVPKKLRKHFVNQTGDGLREP